MAAGWHHSLAVSFDGKVTAVGKNDCAVCDYVDGTRSDECIECAVGKYVKASGSEQMTDRIAFAAGTDVEAKGSDSP